MLLRCKQSAKPQYWNADDRRDSGVSWMSAELHTLLHGRDKFHGYRQRIAAARCKSRHPNSLVVLCRERFHMTSCRGPTRAHTWRSSHLVCLGGRDRQRTARGQARLQDRRRLSSRQAGLGGSCAGCLQDLHHVSGFDLHVRHCIWTQSCCIQQWFLGAKVKVSRIPWRFAESRPLIGTIEAALIVSGAQHALQQIKRGHSSQVTQGVAQYFMRGGFRWPLALHGLGKP